MFHQQVSGISADSRGMVNHMVLGPVPGTGRAFCFTWHKPFSLGYDHSKLDLPRLLWAGILFLTCSQVLPPSQLIPSPREMRAVYFPPHLYLIVFPVTSEVTLVDLMASLGFKMPKFLNLQTLLA